MDNTTSLLDLLQAFNRKERYYLLAAALGVPCFTLADGFRKKLGALFGIEIPRDAYAAMEYHLDWLYAALALFHNPDAGIHPNKHHFHTTSPEELSWLPSLPPMDITSFSLRLRASFPFLMSSCVPSWYA